MTAEQFLSLAEALRSYAQHSGRRDLNAANLFVHSVLMNAVRDDNIDVSRITPREIVQHAQQLDAA